MEILDLFHEMGREKIKMAIMHSIINVVLVFLVINFVFQIFSIPIYVSILISIVLFYISMVRYKRKYSIKYIEKKNPQVEEILETAKDNIKEDNIVTRLFFKDVIVHARKISLGELVNLKTLYFRIFAIVIIAMITMLLPPSDVAAGIDLLDLDMNDRAVFDSIGLRKTDDIFGVPKLIDLGDETLEIEVESSNEFNLDKLTEEEGKDFTKNPFPTQAEAVADTPSNEKLPEDFELIKQYNLEIRGL